MIIPDKILETTRMSESELKQEIAVMLFQKNKLTLGQASDLAAMSRFQFQHLLASRLIPLHYDVKDLEDDLENLKEIAKL
jgi:predicted HTH domain antitoxin